MRVVQAAIAAVALVALAEVGEVEATLAVEHDVVGRRKQVTADLGVEDPALPGRKIDALYGAAAVVGRGTHAHEMAGQIQRAAVVAEIERPIGTEGEAVRPSGGRAQAGDGAIGGNAGDVAAIDLGDDDGAIGQRHRAFGEAEAACDDFDIGHVLCSLHSGACLPRDALR